MMLAEARNFRRAAERLNMSQPPLTVAIRNLERELGAQLFNRGSREVTLTSAGEAAMGYARTTLAQAEAFRVAAREGAAGERGKLRLGYIGSAVFDLLPRLISAFRERYPAVELSLEEATSIGIARSVEAGTLDVGLIRLPVQESTSIRTRTIELDQFYLAVPDAHPLSRHKVIPLSAIADEPFIMSGRDSVLHALALTACHSAGFAPRVAQEASQISAILSLVQSGLGVALVPGRARTGLRDGVQLLELDRPIRIETGLALPKIRATPAADNFAAIAHSA